MAHWARVMASKIPFLQAFLVEDMQTFELVDFLRAFDWIETNNTSKFVSSGDSAFGRRNLTKQNDYPRHGKGRAIVPL
jgi:hypothetical protein